MKKIVILLAIITCLSTNFTIAQDIRINIYTGYVFDDAIDSYYDAYNYYEGTIEGGFQWGGGLEYMIRPTYGVEFTYIRQDTKAPTYYLSDGYIGGAQFANFDLDVNYLMLGGQRHMQKPGGKLDGYAGLMLGMAIANISNPDNGNSASATKFAWGLKGGANIWVTKNVGIKLQGQLLSVSQAMGGSFYFGTGGSGAGLSTYSTIFQFTLGGGLAFRFGGGVQ